MNRTQKTEAVAELNRTFTEAGVVVVTRNLGLTVAESSDLRAKMREAGLVADAAWPETDPALLVDDEVTIAVQVNGKLRDTLSAAKGMPKADLEALALASDKVARQLDGTPPKKIIVIPDRLVNIVA